MNNQTNGGYLLPSGDGGGGAVASVNGLTGAVILNTGNIDDSNNKRYVTDAEKTKLSNLSGTNSGDQNSSGVLLSASLPAPLASETTVHGALVAIAPRLVKPYTFIVRGVTGTPAAGSTNNRVPQFNAVYKNNGGSDATFTNSATLGGYFTILTPGRYFVQGSFISTSNAYAVIAKGMSLNNTLNLNEANLDVYPLGVATAGAGQPFISGYIDCAENELVWLISSSAISALYPGLWKFGLMGPF